MFNFILNYFKRETREELNVKIEKYCQEIVDRYGTNNYSVSNVEWIKNELNAYFYSLTMRKKIFSYIIRVNHNNVNVLYSFDVDDIREFKCDFNERYYDLF